MLQNTHASSKQFDILHERLKTENESLKAYKQHSWEYIYRGKWSLRTNQMPLSCKRQIYLLKKKRIPVRKQILAFKPIHKTHQNLAVLSDEGNEFYTNNMK